MSSDYGDYLNRPRSIDIVRFNVFKTKLNKKKSIKFYKRCDTRRCSCHKAKAIRLCQSQQSAVSGVFREFRPWAIRVGTNCCALTEDFIINFVNARVKCCQRWAKRWAKSRAWACRTHYQVTHTGSTKVLQGP